MTIGGYQLHVDWENDQTFNETADAITASTLSVQCSRGREAPTDLPGPGFAPAGQLTATLKNNDGRFSPLNSAGALFGNIKPGRRVRLRHAGYDALVLADGATTYWRLGEASGLVADETGNTADGTAINVTQGVAGALANDPNLAAAFNGADARIAWTDENNLDLGDVLSIEAWVYRDVLGTQHAIIDKGTGAYRLVVNSSNLLSFQKANTAVIVVSTATVGAGAWHHVVATKNGAAVRLYLDGADVTGTVSNATLVDTTNGLIVGAISSTTTPLAGKLDELALYKNVVLTAAQVAAHYAARDRHQTAALWTGYLDRIEPQALDAGSQDRTATLTAFGALSRLAEKQVSPPAANAGAATGALIEAVLDEGGIDAADYDLDTGQTVTSRWYVPRDTAALDAIRDVEATELGFVFERADGVIAFEDRHHRLTAANSTTSQATLSDDAGDSLYFTSIAQIDPLEWLVNEVIVTVPAFAVGALQTVWTLGASGLEIPPGETLKLIAEYPNKGNSEGAYIDTWTTAQVGIDVIAAGVDPADLAIATLFASTTALKHKGPNHMRISIRNNHAVNTAVLTAVQARGIPVTFGDGIMILAENTASKTAYGRRTYEFPGPWLPSVGVGQDYADYLVAQYKDPRPGLTLTYNALRDAAHRTEALTREVSDRVTVTATGAARLGIDADWYVEGIEHRIEDAGHWHEVTYLLSPVAAGGVAGSSFWVLGTSALDTGTILAF